MNALKALQSFHSERKLAAAVICYITNSLNTKQSEEKLLQIFKEFDKNRDGTLTIDELKEGFVEYLGEKMFFQTDLKRILTNVDLN